MGEERGIPEEGTDVAKSGGVQRHRVLGKTGMARKEGSKKKRTGHEHGGRDTPKP